MENPLPLALANCRCRCSLTYEEVIGGIKQELQSARKHRQQLQAQVRMGKAASGVW